MELVLTYAQFKFHESSLMLNFSSIVIQFNCLFFLEFSLSFGKYLSKSHLGGEDFFNEA